MTLAEKDYCERILTPQEIGIIHAACGECGVDVDKTILIAARVKDGAIVCLPVDVDGKPL